MMKVEVALIVVLALLTELEAKDAKYVIPCDYGCHCVDNFWIPDEDEESSESSPFIFNASLPYEHLIQFGRYHMLEIDCRSRRLENRIPALMTNATRLLLAHNHFESIPAGAFREYTEVAELDLTYNGIKEIHETAFRGMKSLTILSLTGNELVSLPDGIFNGLHNLFALYLDYNEFKEFPHFKPLENLSTLYMNYNKLEKITADVFADTVWIHRIGLYGNKLTTFPASFARFLNNYPSSLVTIGGNPWRCDCHMLAIKEIWPAHPRLLFDTFYCGTPSRLRGQNIWHIESSELLCGVADDYEAPTQERPAPKYTLPNMMGAAIGGALLATVLTCVVWAVLWRKGRCRGRAGDTTSFVPMENKNFKF
ncbi:carboxypeptidase N subunit 2-like [Ptychodera flava]|uniref:carboxypeptidase N subunit 2-like n=1 Tax=Ptychodera flava TaxID=63121 RepID=UPI003969F346